VKLFSREYGNGDPIVILHGLFGSSDNWLTQAKLLSEKFRVITVDLRNHGQSPHDDQFDYESMVDDLSEFFDDHQLANATLIGHSMGGKTAMNFALAHPEKIEKLIVVDIAPRLYDLEHYVIADGLAAMPVAELTSRKEAEDILGEYVSDMGTRQFLLKNLQRQSSGGFSWKMNLKVIREKLSNVGADLSYEGTFSKPVLFIRGSRSSYVLDTDIPHIKEVFPNVEIQTLETGHWVQAEKPQEFCEHVTDWLARAGD
jgi:Predicted hydrolases or acyltransferases (alpha/beta hydrolase superfamily)